MSPDRTPVTILFTDIVDSTARAAELGDREWRHLLDRHDEIVRQALNRFQGKEVNTAGDGFLASFDRPSTAIRCAWEIRNALRDIDIEVRAGIHIGTVEGRGEDIAGLSVHTGARIAALARPGEILVSNTVADIEAGSEFVFEDRGTHELKGVPGEWRVHALQSVPELTHPPTESRASRGAPMRVMIAAATVTALVIAVLVGVRFRGSSERAGDSSPPRALAAVAAPGIAVLPFAVTGEELDDWREGMVTLLSTNLDGAGRLRAIDSRTVLARWDQAIDAGRPENLTTALDVASDVGAAYAVVGSATSIGDDVRLGAAVYDVSTGARIGLSEIDGAADSLFTLVDGATRGVLGALLEEGRGEIPHVDLAALTTRSIRALKEYLEGEIAFRGSRFDDAIASFERAVEADSTFALAWLRIGQSFGWMEYSASPRVIEAHRRAAQFSGRLPEREAAIVKASLARQLGYTDDLDMLRQVTRAYPDDAEAHYMLGEMLYHVRNARGTLDEVEASFRRAAELDPGFTPYRIHWVQMSLIKEPDPAKAARRLAVYEEFAHETLHTDATRLALQLINDELSASTRDSLIDSLDVNMLRRIRAYLWHPRYWEVRRQLNVALADAGAPRPHDLFWNDLYQRGHLGRALESIATEGGPHWFPMCHLRHAWSMGVPVPDDVLETFLAIAPSDTLPSPRTDCGAAYAAAMGRWAQYDQAVGVHRRFVARLEADGAEEAARFERAILDGMLGHGAWKRGRLDEAEAFLRRAADEPANPVQYSLWLAQLLMERGRPDEAIPYYQTLRFNPLSDLYLAEALEAAGQPEAAAEAYRSLINNWSDPDAELAFFVERAHEGLARAGGLPED